MSRSEFNQRNTFVRFDMKLSILSRTMTSMEWQGFNFWRIGSPFSQEGLYSNNLVICSHSYLGEVPFEFTFILIWNLITEVTASFTSIVSTSSNKWNKWSGDCGCYCGTLIGIYRLRRSNVRLLLIEKFYLIKMGSRSTFSCHQALSWKRDCMQSPSIAPKSCFLISCSQWLTIL